MNPPFTYDLPKELIAQRPLAERDAARLMVISRADGSISHRVFRDLPEYLSGGEALVLNDTKVIPARIPARKETGGKAEVFLLRREGQGVWNALVRGGSRTGSVLHAGPLAARVTSRREDGSYLVEFTPGDDAAVLAQGVTPLPPYIHRPAEPGDAADYQTVYAEQPGSVAAPTAGLHFTSGLLARIRGKGVAVCSVTLDLGWASFRINRPNAPPEPPQPEHFSVSAATAQAICHARASGHDVTAVGTSVVRALESQPDSGVAAFAGTATLVIESGFRFRFTNRLLTNFHLPGSSHLSLVAAFAGTALAEAAYHAAVEQRYRFYSYGDAMLVM